ncbi:unnamed protein product, partial [Urochloa humidicola]
GGDLVRDPAAGEEQQRPELPDLEQPGRARGSSSPAAVELRPSLETVRIECSCGWIFHSHDGKLCTGYEPSLSSYYFPYLFQFLPTITMLQILWLLDSPLTISRHDKVDCCLS